MILSIIWLFVLTGTLIDFYFKGTEFLNKYRTQDMSDEQKKNLLGIKSSHFLFILPLNFII